MQILNDVIQINQRNIVKTMYTKSLINLLGTFEHIQRIYL